MTADEYFNQQISLFKKTYCHSKEDQIFIKYSGAFNYLYEFLLNDPDAEILNTDIKWQVSDSKKRIFSRIDTWYGDITFRWKGKKITIRSLLIIIHGYGENAFLISCESLALLNELEKNLDLFSVKQHRCRYSGTIFSPTRDIKSPNVSWEMVYLPDEMKKDIKHSIETFFNSRLQYEKFGLPYRRGFLFTGPPGCGKTMTIKAIASTQKVFCSAFIPHNGRNDLYELEIVFEYAQKMSPSIVILEDLDKFGNSIPISVILNLLDGLDAPMGVLTIATNNESDKLDPALLLRPSRFDRVWNFPLPAFEERLKLLKKISKGKIDENILIETAKKSNGFSMAYVQEIFATALSIATEENREVEGLDLIVSVEILRKQVKNTKILPEIIGKNETKLGFNINT